MREVFSNVTRIGGAPSSLAPASRRVQFADKAVKLAKRKACTSGHVRRVARDRLPVRLPRVPFHQRRRRRGAHAPSHGHRGRALAVTEAASLRNERLLDLNARPRGVDANAKSAGNAEWLQLSATAPHHREVVSGGGHQAFLRPADGCADAEAPLAGPHPADACRPPSAPCGVGTGPTSWTAISTWQYHD